MHASLHLSRVPPPSAFMYACSLSLAPPFALTHQMHPCRHDMFNVRMEVAVFTRPLHYKLYTTWPVPKKMPEPGDEVFWRGPSLPTLLGGAQETIKSPNTLHLLALHVPGLLEVALPSFSFPLRFMLPLHIRMQMCMHMYPAEADVFKCAQWHI